MKNLLILLCLCLSPLAGADPAADLAEAARTYNLQKAQALAHSLEPTGDLESILLRANARLLIAELMRIEFEQLPEGAARQRRALGKDIDATVDGGLSLVNALPDNSDKYRMKADLIGAKIRSPFRAGKYKDEMNQAVAEALHHDPNNARAHVSNAKTWILRPSATREELRRGLVCLDTALGLDNTLEQAWLLRAYALEKLGETDKAAALWKQCLDRNPDCAPARDALEKQGAELGGR